MGDWHVLRMRITTQRQLKYLSSCHTRSIGRLNRACADTLSLLLAPTKLQLIPTLCRDVPPRVETLTHRFNCGGIVPLGLITAGTARFPPSSHPGPLHSAVDHQADELVVLDPIRLRTRREIRVAFDQARDRVDLEQMMHKDGKQVSKLAEIISFA